MIKKINTFLLTLGFLATLSFFVSVPQTTHAFSFEWLINLFSRPVSPVSQEAAVGLATVPAPLVSILPTLNIRGVGVKVKSSGTVISGSGGTSGLTTQTVGTPCYYPYTPPVLGSTYTLTVNNGAQTKDLILPTTRPASILQDFNFSATNIFCIPQYQGDQISEFFVLNTGQQSNGSFSLGNYPNYYEYGVLQPGIYLGDYWFSGSYIVSANNADRILKEDAIINSVNATHSLTSRISNRGVSVSVSVPEVTNCVKISGNGPRKVVFMRGRTFNSSIGDFLGRVDAAITDLKKIEPYRQYQDSFSFYADLKKYPEPGRIIDVPNITAYYVGDPKTNIFSSSCSNGVPEIDVVFISNGLGSSSENLSFVYNSDNGWTSQFGKTIFLKDLTLPRSKYLGQTYLGSLPGVFNDPAQSGLGVRLAYQLGRSIGGLNKESRVIATDNNGTPIVTGFIGDLETDSELPAPIVNGVMLNLTQVFTNCSLNPTRDYRIGSMYYGSTTKRGCTYLNGKETPRPSEYYRPSTASIMNTVFETIPSVPDTTSSSKFNVISCGYIVAGLRGEIVTRENAKKYWPECYNLDTDKADLPPVIPPPVINTVNKTVKTSLNSTPSTFARLIQSAKSALLAAVGVANTISLMAGDTLTVSGSGFTATNNAAQLTNTTNASNIYEILDIPSPNQATISFEIPTTTPAGTYTLKVGAFNSNWSPVLATLSISAYAPPLVITAVSPTVGRSFTITGSGFSPTGNTVRITPTPLQTTGSWLGRAVANAPRTISGLTSNGTTLTFTIPDNTTPNKQYKISVSNASGEWRHTELLITVPPIGGYPPVLTTFNHNPAVGGSWILISGSGFSTSTTANTDKIRLTANSGQVVFESIAGISSGSPGTIVAPPTPTTLIGQYTAFQIPTTVSPGTYKVTMSNSLGYYWSGFLYFTVLPARNANGTYNLAPYPLAYQILPATTVVQQRASIAKRIETGVTSELKIQTGASLSQAVPLANLTNKLFSLTSKSEVSQDIQSGTAYESQLGALIVERKEKALQMMKDNPLLFSSLAIRSSDKGKLPEIVQNNIEQEIELTGRLNIIHVDDFINQKNSRFEYRLDVDGATYPTSGRGLWAGLKPKVTSPNISGEHVLYTINAPKVGRSGARVKIKGFKLDNVVSVDSVSDAIEVVDSAPALESVGNQKTLVLLIKPSVGTPEPFTLAEAREKVFNSQFQAFMREQSYNKVSFSGDVYGWFTVPPSIGFPTAEQLGAIATQAGINMDLYDRVVYIDTENYMGFSTVGKIRLDVNGASRIFSQALVGVKSDYEIGHPFSWKRFDYLLSHEMGHSLGVIHSNALDCGDRSFSGDCSLVEYGNIFSVMGNGYSSLHFNGYSKELLGWIAPENSLAIATSGTYTINPLEIASGKNVANIFIPGTSHPIFSIEFRKGIGFDSSLNKPAYISNQSGLMINSVIPGNSTRLLDMSPTTKEFGSDIHEATLNISGGIFSDLYHGISIGPVLSVDSSSVVFNVNFSPLSCVRAVPTISIGDVSSVVSGGYGNMQVYYRNTDYPACSSSLFSISNDFPPGWTYTLNPLSDPMLTPEENATRLVKFQVPVGTVPGTYKVISRLVNTISGLNRSITTDVIVVGPPDITVVPASGVVGAPITIQATNLGSVDNNTVLPVEFYNATGDSWRVNLPVTVLSGGQQLLNFTVPATVKNCLANGRCTEKPTPLGTFKIKVSRNGLESNEVDFSVLSPLVIVGGIEPAISAVTRSFIVRGSGFTPTGNTVTIRPFRLAERNLPNLTYTMTGLASNGTSLAFTVPDSAPPKLYTVSFENANGDRKDNAKTLTVYALGTSRIVLTSFDHDSAVAGSWILIRGSGFSNSTTTNTDRVTLDSPGVGNFEVSAGILGDSPGMVIPPPTPTTPIGQYTAFQIPTTVPAGIYSVSLQNKDGPWSNILSLRVLPRVKPDGSINLPYLLVYQPTLSVTSFGSTVWIHTVPQTVTWSSTNLPAGTLVYIYAQEGSSEIRLANAVANDGTESVVATAGSFSPPVTPVRPGNYRLVVRAYHPSLPNGGLQAMSTRFFEVMPFTYHPADTNRDGRIVLAEITAYGTQSGYLIAGEIYRRGEAYTWDNVWKDARGVVILPTLTVTKSGLGAGTVTGGGINCGAVCTVRTSQSLTLIATPDSKSLFVGWGGDCTSASSSGSCVLHMTTDRNVNAIFDLDRIPPLMTYPQIFSDQSRAQIKWSTDELALGAVRYDLPLGGGTKIEREVGQMTLNHSVTLTGLSPDATYSYKIISTDQSQNSKESTVGNFKTLAIVIPPQGGYTPGLPVAPLLLQKFFLSASPASHKINFVKNQNNILSWKFNSEITLARSVGFTDTVNLSVSDGKGTNFVKGTDFDIEFINGTSFGSLDVPIKVKITVYAKPDLSGRRSIVIIPLGGGLGTQINVDVLSVNPVFKAI